MRAALVVFLVGCTWSRSRVVVGLAAADSALFACDATQTYAASNGGMWDGAVREGDPIQGARPSGARMYELMAIDIGIAVAITASPLPDWAKAGALGVIGANVTHTVVRNNRFAASCGL